MAATGWINIFFLLFASVARADCADFGHLYGEGQRQFSKQQFLFASIQFKLASQFACDHKNKGKALFFYALSMNQLSEKSEVFDSLQEVELLAVPDLSRRVNMYKAIDLNFSSPALLDEDQTARMRLWKEREFKDMPYKSPWMAGALSAVLPGAGQAYVGAWQSGLYSFAINSLFLAAAMELNRKGLQTSSITAGVVFSITYFGGILSATQSANIYNRNQLIPFENELHYKLFPEFYP